VSEEISKPKTINGNEMTLDNGNMVWLGKTDEKRYVAIFTKEDKKTRIILSEEAMHALVNLYISLGDGHINLY
jgi:hypothetical protein